MVKFQKQLQTQLVAEWINSYVNYKQLKKDIKQIRQQIASKEEHLIVHHKTRKSSSGGREMVYETELIYGQSPWAEHDRVFFSRLDSQLNKVNKFYTTKEKEYLVRDEQLQVQLETLIDTKLALSASKIYDHSNAQEVDTGVQCLRVSEKCTNAYDFNMEEYGENNGAYIHKVGHAEKMLHTAFIEYYKGLTLLQNYSTLNAIAFRKILKKYDKVTGKGVSETYLKEVQSSYFSTNSKKLLSMVETVENLFTKHFSKNNRRRAMRSLRPSPHKNSSGEFFSLGFFSGCSWGLMLALVFAVSKPHISSYVISKSFQMNVVPIFSSSNLQHINPSVFPHLYVILVFVFLPFDICYRSARFYFIRCLWRIICAPLYKVEFADFFLADQLTSQITTLRSLGYISFYHASQLLHHNSDNSVCSSPLFQFPYIVAVLPYWWRLMQCVKSWVDERELSQIANGGKYMFAIIAMVIRFKYESSSSKLFLVLFMTSSSIATVYQFYWDVVIDWGLLQRKSVNPWLRDQLISKNKRIYFISMFVNAVLRLAWLYSIIHVVMPCGPTYQKYIDFILGMAEIARRGLWIFFRLENEHLDSVDKSRAVKIVPLPFKCIDPFV
ncbi:phosphate transporter PHO1-like [Cryptomeria japonica]|uniref:phosphate transporter PHO1-like n=1 Tax=Cryptomeria japonica TaxID=3369 RepID=UPI0027DA1C60|nr:phosphate transporter PHO1-like [Cryptomeria japonica]